MSTRQVDLHWAAHLCWSQKCMVFIYTPWTLIYTINISLVLLKHGDLLLNFFFKATGKWRFNWPYWLHFHGELIPVVCQIAGPRSWPRRTWRGFSSAWNNRREIGRETIKQCRILNLELEKILKDKRDTCILHSPAKGLH